MKTIIMDFNDTIDNTAQAELRGLSEIIKTYKIKISPRELLINLNYNYLNLTGNYQSIIKKTLTQAGISKDDINDALKIFNREANETKLKAGFSEVLKNFNVIIFTAANKEGILKLLKKNDIKTNKIIFYDNIIKPSLIDLKRVIEEQELNPKETIYIGDDVIRDLLPAKELGLRTVIINDYVDYNINKLSEIMKFK